MDDADMSPDEVLPSARAVGIHLVVDGNDLLLTASAPPPPGFLDLLRDNKAEIIAALTAAKASGEDIALDWRDWYEERAAIRQFDGGE